MEDMKKDYKFVEPYKNVQINLPDGRALSGPRGAAVGEFLKLLEDDVQPPIVGAIINGELRELTYAIEIESNVTPLRLGTADGMRIYRRSLTFLLEMAFSRIYSDSYLLVDHSIFSGGYYCKVEGREELSEKELMELEAEMRRLVEADLPFEKKRVPLDEAIAYFQAKGMHDKVRLIKHRKKDYLVLYSIGDYRDYHHGYMVPSSGFIRWFALILMEGGFALKYPRRNSPMEIQPIIQNPKLLYTFRDYGKWLERLEIENVGALNDAILEGRIQEVILVSEALHERRIAAIASEIVKRAEDVRVVLVAGPSSSGKTTFSKRLSIQLLAHGISPFPLEMDNFFVERTKTPRDASGEYDFEHIDAINRQRLNQDILKLIAGEYVRLPNFDFVNGTSTEGEEVQLEPGQMVIVEGIHGLNPELLPEVPEERTFRVYCSALTQLNLDRHNRVSTTDTRLVRRIVRDDRTRGYSPQETIQRWESVRRGEKRYIFPYQENADVMFNSALIYELSALRLLAEPLLRQVPLKTEEHIEVKRLLALLEWFLPLDATLIPDNSILLEFIGGNILKSFKLWKRQIL
jgi:uridine kinase